MSRWVPVGHGHLIREMMWIVDMDAKVPVASLGLYAVGIGWHRVDYSCPGASDRVVAVTHWRKLDTPSLPGAELDTDNPPCDWMAIAGPSPAERAILADKHMAQLRELTDEIVDWIDGVMEDRAIRKIEMRECIEEILAEKAKAEAAHA